MKRHISLLAVGLLFAASIVATIQPTNVKAQNSSTGFLVSPVRVEMSLDPGKSETTTLSVENVTGGTVTAKPIVNDFEPAQDESGQPKIILDENASAGSQSFKTLVGNLPSVTLGPKEKKDIPIKISVPGNASAGGYYGAIRFISEADAGDKNVALSASVGTIFLIRVSGNLTEELSLVEFTAAKNGSTGRFFMNAGDMSVVTRLKNTGNIHVKPFGRVQISDRSGKVVVDYEFNSTEPRANVLPDSTRKFVDPLKSQKWIGKYTMTVNLGYGTGGNLITAKNTF